MHLWKATYNSEDEKDLALRDVALAKSIGEHLEKHYKGHFFRVTVESAHGIARISHPLLPVGWAYTIKLHDLFSDPGMKCVTKAGGELLERFYLRRGKRRQDHWEEASQKYYRIKHNMLREWDMTTGERRFILPPELTR